MTPERKPAHYFLSKHRRQFASGFPSVSAALASQAVRAGTPIIAGASSSFSASADIFGSRAYLKNEYLKRAVAAKVGLYGNSKEEALYPLYLTDAEGKPLDGSKDNYVINFAADQLPPAQAFWSVTMYDGKSQTLVTNPINRYLINSSMLDNLKRNADGGPELARASAIMGVTDN